MATVVVSHVRKRFGSTLAVDDVSFEVHAGEIFGLLGPNGAGKTTTIRMMLDIFRPDGGEISVLGGALDEAKKNRIGYMPEERGLYKDLKLEPTLVYLATLKGLSQAAARERLETWLRRLDLWEHRGKKVQDLSRGMQQKAQLIATLAHEPDLIVVDEPFAGLDPVNTRLVKEIMEEQRQAGRTIIMSTHQMHQVETLCNRIVLIHRGRSVLYGEVDQIQRDFRGNSVLVEGKGELPSIPGVSQVEQPANAVAGTAANGAVHLALSPGTSPQDLFRTLANQTAFTVERFEIAEPSLEEIFVKVVQGEAQNV
jgi:ABC-2 type transport system ATP-binding protein